jgi:lysophospholipase L1-like esterase
MKRGSPPGLLGMLGLVLAVELFVAGHPLHFRSPAGWVWRTAGEEARRAAPGCEVLCFGDSLVKCGVAPRVLAARSGLRAYNLALSGGTAPASYFLLRRALEAGARPAAVLVDFDALTLAFAPEICAHVWPELLDLRDGWDLARVARDGHFSATLLLSALPSVRCRGDVRASVLSAFRGEVPSTLFASPAYRRNAEANLGAIINPDAPRSGGGFAMTSPAAGPGWRPHPVNVVFVRRFLRLAAAHGVPVFWLVPPSRPGAQAPAARASRDAAYDRFIGPLLAEFPALTLVDGRRAGYEARAFFDAVHLNRRGAASLSAALSDLLAGGSPGPGGPRHVALPAYRERPVAAALEDLDQSCEVAAATLSGVSARAAPGNTFLAAPQWFAQHRSFVERGRRVGGPVLFLGDSITYGWGDLDPALPGSGAWASFAALGARAFGIAGDQTQSLLWRVEHGELEGRPKAVVLLIGINNLVAGRSPTETAAGVAAVVGAIRRRSPRAKVLLLGLLPASAAAGRPDEPLRVAIRETNALIAGLDRPGAVTYLDVGALFLRPDGTIEPGLMPGFLHPGPRGYAALAAAIRGPLRGLLGAPDTTTASDPGPAGDDRTFITPPGTRAGSLARARCRGPAPAGRRPRARRPAGRCSRPSLAFGRTS